MTIEIVYPALYTAANQNSNAAQGMYLRLIRAEYSALFIAAIFTVWNFTNVVFYVAYALVFFLAAGLLISRYAMKPEQSWYQCRALAESVKTTTWRYMMRAEPFENAEHIQIPRGEFRNHLRAILRANKHVADHIAGPFSADSQIDSSMDNIRMMALEDRKELYRRDRINDQRNWYTMKASANKRAFKFWIRACVCIYVLASASVLLRIGYPEWTIWPTEPLIVLASSFIGWMQIKKFSELSASYSLTSHEIGILQNKLQEVDAEDEFSAFVNEAELAFSREHTQWVARQSQ